MSEERGRGRWLGLNSGGGSVRKGFDQKGGEEMQAGEISIDPQSGLTRWLFKWCPDFFEGLIMCFGLNAVGALIGGEAGNWVAVYGLFLLILSVLIDGARNRHKRASR